MNPLIEKIRAARQKNIEAGGYTFTVRRPTDIEVLQMRGQNVREGDILKRFVVGWDNVKELDLIPGGTGMPVEFDSDLFIEWIADRPDLWAPIIAAVNDGYEQHQKDSEQRLGKFDSG